MQLIPRYLVDNIITIVGSEQGLSTEMMPVYTRQIKVYKGIDNTIQFKLLNADHKPINIELYKIMFVAFDDNERKVIERECHPYMPTDSSVHRGKFQVVITENDLNNLPRQNMRYNIYLIDEENRRHITYVDSHFDNNATIVVDDYAFPPAKPAGVAEVFTPDNNFWYSEYISAQPALNGSEALHTVAIYTTGYEGKVTVQATLENTLASPIWGDLFEISLAGDETEPVARNFNGVFSYLRVKFDNDPVDKIKKIMIRD